MVAVAVGLSCSGGMGSLTTAMESVKRSSACTKRPPKTYSTQKWTQRPPSGPHPVTCSSKKQTTTTNAIPEHDEEPVPVDQCQFNTTNGPVSMLGLLQTATKGPQSSGAPVGPKMRIYQC